MMLVIGRDEVIARLNAAERSAPPVQG
jgi:hypothetical protein